jgi:septal ring factor EnvC (AmiA/AmiB activator)
MPRSNAELKLLLNQKSSAELRRSLGLYTYLQNAQRDAILESINALQTASQLEQETLGKQHTLEQKQLELSTLSVQLIAEKEKKEGLIETLKTTISEKSLSRKALHDRQKDLQKVLVEVGETLIQAQEKALPQGNILAMQGQLAWPIETPALSANSISLTKNRGLLIKISPNTPVKAIYPGKVVFADWLKGYGLLIIIDHGDKFMSLYAYNDQLLKHPGEQVLQGDIIAMVGDADQNPEDMNLYFELRHQGEPVNPTQWLSERG